MAVLLDGLDIIDVSDPTSPIVRGNFNTSRCAYEVVLSADGNTAFVADYDNLAIINVSNPASPSLTATLEIPAEDGDSVSTNGVTLSADGNTAFVASSNDGLHIVDISELASPSLTATLDTSGSARGVTLSADGNTAFVADYISGLQIIDIGHSQHFQRRVIPQALKYQAQHSHRLPTTPPPVSSPLPAAISPPMQVPITISTSPNSPSPEKAATPTHLPQMTLNAHQPPPSLSPLTRLINSNSLAYSIKTAPPPLAAPLTTSLLL